ncbi:hypothetical protein [Paraphotobacterium marinum]|uniref:hypothetical protein n=1 Tax=Paraphotobacterium marinum TaxID=1755811 RepID=UPI00131405B2|nr:hypothetical protein [Paraphotobacterium marinum]
MKNLKTFAIVICTLAGMAFTVQADNVSKNSDQTQYQDQSQQADQNINEGRHENTGE